MHQLPQENLGCHKQLYTFLPSSSAYGTKQCHIGIASYPRPWEEDEKVYSRLRYPRFSWGSWRMRVQKVPGPFSSPSKGLGTRLPTHKLYSEAQKAQFLQWRHNTTNYGIAGQTQTFLKVRGWLLNLEILRKIGQGG